MSLVSGDDHLECSEAFVSAADNHRAWPARQASDSLHKIGRAQAADFLIIGERKMHRPRQ